MTLESSISNHSEAEERAHLAHVTDRIHRELMQFDERSRRKRSEALEIKKFLNDHKGDMDHAEKISMRLAADQATLLTDHAEQRRQMLMRLCNSPYFGRIDFTPGDRKQRTPYYIGLNSFHDPETDRHLVHDWRAPVSSMFYHHETGPAAYEAPDGRVDGVVVLKRQYRIEGGELEFMLETEMNIHDDVLQRELSRSADDKMKNIVATIQRDQNSIIRDDQTHALVIQGAAGSGKTSIALHRIAYLLYRYKDTLRSADVLIISPNKVFAHYISRVLPELGEEMIREITMEELATRFLGPQTAFQTFAEQVAKLLDRLDPAYEQRIHFKSGSDFLDELEEYARLLRRENVMAREVDVGGGMELPADWVAAEFARCNGQPFTEQLSAVTDAAVQHVRDRTKRAITGAARQKIRSQLKAMLRHPDIHAAYEGFYHFLAEPEMLRRGPKGEYEYTDVFPLIHLRMLLDGVPVDNAVKHLVIDEMQDYSAVQYRVLSQVFPCRKTILGDSHQSVNPLNSSDAEAITGMIPRARAVTMNKSYRSTLQIANFSLGIRPNPDIEPVERHGEEPVVAACTDEPEQDARIETWLREYLQSDHQTCGIICKTQKQADALHRKLQPVDPDIHLLDSRSTNFDGGVIIATAHLVKGLEFDEVIVPDVDAVNYRTGIDRQMLYVACTRAMHRLRLCHTGERTSFLGFVDA